jgi:hypothetical protein
VLLQVHAFDGCLGLVAVFHFHEAEALAAAGVFVGDDLRALDRAEWREEALEIRAGDIVTQVPHVQIGSHREFSFEQGPGDRASRSGPKK